MAGNTSPIFSRIGDIQGLGGVITAAATGDYTGSNINTVSVFRSDKTNGGYIQRLRFKAKGTNVATVARIYICDEYSRLAYSLATNLNAVTPTGTPSTTGGTLLAGTYYAKIVVVDQYGAESTASLESAAVTTTGRTGSITWSWGSAITGAAKYEIYVGPTSNGQMTVFIQTDGTASSYTQTTPVADNNETVGLVNDSANLFYGEVSLPATTASATAATVDIDYPMNLALPPNHVIVIGLGTAVAAGWEVVGIGGAY